MMKLEDIIQSIKTTKSVPTDDDLRNLPYDLLPRNWSNQGETFVG